MPTGISISSGGSITTNNAVYVAANGVDATGARNNLAKPFLTLEAAKAVAVSGDTIYVYPGTYTITTTDSNGIAKSGVNYVFAPGCIINKSSAGDMFNDNGFALPCNVFAYGSTFSKTGSSGAIYRQLIPNAIFEATTVTNTTTHCFVTYRGEVHFKVDYATSTAGAVLCMAQQNSYATNRIRVDMVTWRSTANNVIGGFTWWYYTDLVVNGSVMESTAANAVDYVEAANCVFNVVKILGTNYGITANDFGGNIAINCAYCTGFSGTGQVRLNGHCQKINFGNYTNAQSFVGGTSANITVTGGTVTTALQCYSPGENAFITISGGTLNVTIGTATYGWSIASTGGLTNIYGAIQVQQLSYGVDRLVNGGTVNVYANFTHGGTLDNGKVYFLKLQSGTLRLRGNMRNNFDTVGSHGIVWSGGTLIVDGVSMYLTNAEAYPIQALSAGLNLKVLSGGMSTNKISGLTSGKKHRWKYTIIAVANTTVYLNDTTGGDEIFTETNTGTYNTKALLAQRMVTLINASGTLDLTASQDTPGTDDYFYVEADIAGVQIARGNPLGNLTALEIRQGSYAMTNITGGTIIEDADVE